MKELSKTDSDNSAIVQIDDHRLDRECIRLPEQILVYSTKMADARANVDERKAELEVCEAEIKKDARKRPEAYGMEKATEGSLTETVLTSPVYQKKLARLNKAKHDQDICYAVVTALEAKKKALSMLVELHATGWHAAPKVSAKGREAVDEMTKRRTHVAIQRRDRRD